MAHPLAQARRLCLFSHWSADGEVALYVRLHLEAIRAAGFAIAFVSSGPLSKGAAAALQPLCGLVEARENVGYDFGAWRHALGVLGELQAERLLLVNDSVYGPFAPLRAFLAELERRPGDVWGAIESSAYGRHLQSWFLLLTPAAYRAPAFRALLRDPVDPGLSKWALVNRYEIGLSRAWIDAGLRLGAAYVAQAHGSLARDHPFNPCGALWRELVEGPVPYIKASLLRANPTLSAGVGRWRETCGRLAPHLVAAIADDLAARGAQPPTSLAARLAASKTRRLPQDWPEVQAVLRRNHRHIPGSSADRCDRLAYAAAAALGARLRGRT